MEFVSIIVTAHNKAAELPRTLQSAHEAIAFARAIGDPTAPGEAEIVVVDDGSTDATQEVLRDFASSSPITRVIRRATASSPSCARNTGAAASRGSLLFFLDGDDLFLPRHIAACCRELADRRWDFVKTGVHLADPVLPDWKEWLENSLVLNLCVRRHCHFAVGGFPDWHLFIREGDHFRHVVDVFYKYEDMYYNRLVGSSFVGCRVAEETVQYIRYPGNCYDRMYEKFQQPFVANQEILPPEVKLHIGLGDVIIQDKLEQLRYASRQQSPLGSV